MNFKKGEGFVKHLLIHLLKHKRIFIKGQVNGQWVSGPLVLVGSQGPMELAQQAQWTKS
jgi:hypothetical protein